MKPITLPHTFLNLVFSTLMVAVMAAVAPTGADASGDKVGNIEVEHVWARASIGQVKSGGAYMEIENEGSTADRLIGVASTVAKKTELHSMVMEDDVMKMRHVMAIEIPAGGETKLKPGGFHVMFMGLHKPLVEGEMFPLTLTFEKAGELTVMVHITKATAMEGMEMDHNNMDHSN